MFKLRYLSVLFVLMAVMPSVCFGVDCLVDKCKISGSSSIGCNNTSVNDRNRILKDGEYGLGEIIKFVNGKEGQCNGSFRGEHVAKCKWQMACKKDVTNAFTVLSCIAECENGYVGKKPTDTERQSAKDHYKVDYLDDEYAECVARGTIKAPDVNCPSGDDYAGAKKCNSYYVDNEDGSDDAYHYVITECESGGDYESIPVDDDFKNELKREYGIDLSSGTFYKKCAKLKCSVGSRDYSIGEVIEENIDCESTENKNNGGGKCDVVCVQEKGEDADKLELIKTCAKGHVKDKPYDDSFWNKYNAGSIKDAGYLQYCKTGKSCNDPNSGPGIEVNSGRNVSTYDACKSSVPNNVTESNVNLVSSWQVYCKETDKPNEPKLQCRPSACIAGYYPNDNGKCVPTESELNNNSSTGGTNAGSGNGQRTELTQQQKLEKAKKTLMVFKKSIDEHKTVWKDASGNFNKARLASDLTAGVVLGTVGGVVSGVVIKKKQLQKGYEDLHCTVGGQSVADWGDDFRIGYTRR